MGENEIVLFYEAIFLALEEIKLPFWFGYVFYEENVRIETISHIEIIYWHEIAYTYYYLRNLD